MLTACHSLREGLPLRRMFLLLPVCWVEPPLLVALMIFLPPLPPAPLPESAPAAAYVHRETIMPLLDHHPQSSEDLQDINYWQSNLQTNWSLEVVLYRRSKRDTNQHIRLTASSTVTVEPHNNGHAWNLQSSALCPLSEVKGVVKGQEGSLSEQWNLDHHWSD